MVLGARELHGRMRGEDRGKRTREALLGLVSRGRWRPPETEECVAEREGHEMEKLGGEACDTRRLGSRGSSGGFAMGLLEWQM